MLKMMHETSTPSDAKLGIFNHSAKRYSLLYLHKIEIYSLVTISLASATCKVRDFSSDDLSSFCPVWLTGIGQTRKLYKWQVEEVVVAGADRL